MSFSETKTLAKNRIGKRGFPISRALSRSLARMDVERARWIHGDGAQVRTLADMSTDEIAALEAQYGAKVRT